MMMSLVTPELGGPWTRGPSEHLTWSEMRCNDGTPFPEEWREERALPLGVEFEWIRATCGGAPIEVGSAFRTWYWNTKVKGARKSTHPRGLALDLYPPANLGLPFFVDAVIKVAHRPGGMIRGIGVYRTFVHVDIREGNRVSRWRGTRASAEVWKKVRDA